MLINELFISKELATSRYIIIFYTKYIKNIKNNFLNMQEEIYFHLFYRRHSYVNAN